MTFIQINTPSGITSEFKTQDPPSDTSLPS